MLHYIFIKFLCSNNNVQNAKNTQIREYSHNLWHFPINNINISNSHKLGASYFVNFIRSSYDISICFKKIFKNIFQNEKEKLRA